MTAAMSYREDSRTSLAFILSVLLHVMLGMAIVGFFVFRPATPPAPSKFFELVAAPPSDSPSNEEAAPGSPSLSMPNLPTSVVPTPPQPAEVTPQPTPAVAQPPTPAPALSHAATVVPKPPTNQAPLTDHEKFLKAHNLTNTPAPAHATGRPVPNVGVNVNSIVKNLQNASSGANGQGRGRANAASSSETQDYISMLVARLRDAFVPPGGISGQSAEIYLEIGPNGELAKKYISRSSGNAEFDAAVNDALQRLTNVDPPPGGVQVGHNFVFTPSD